MYKYVHESKDGLVKISERMFGQDNMATAHPIFTVQQRRRIYGMDPEYSDNIVWLLDGSEYDESDEACRKAMEHYEEYSEVPVDWDRTCFIDIWVFVQPFFSFKGAEKYIEENRHNLNDPRIYVESAYRNDEWQAARNFIESRRNIRLLVQEDK